MKGGVPLNILIIAWKEIKFGLRNIRTLFFTVAFPVILILVLGTALSNTFSTSIPVQDIHVLYQDQTANSAFRQLISAAKNSGIHFTKVTSQINGKKEVKQNKYDGYVEASQSGINLYLNNENSVAGNIIQGMLSSYVDRYNIITEIGKTAPQKLPTILNKKQGNQVIQETSLTPNKQPNSMDYYSIVLTTMIVLYGAISASMLIVGERIRKTAIRLIVAPLNKAEIFTGKVLGNLVSTTICVALVMVISKFLYRANWGDHLGLVFLVLFTEIIFAVSFGLGLSFLTKENTIPTFIILIFVQLASFFGGSYFKIDNPHGFFKFITDLSPLTWMNHGLIKLIYTNDFSATIPAMAINLIGALLFLLIAIVALRRREGL